MKVANKTSAKLAIARRYTRAGIHPRDQIKWELRDVAIKDESSGKTVFEQKGVEVPSDWSERAVQIVVNKYFYGKLGTSERETSVHQLIERVTQTFAKEGLKHGYFDSEEEAESFAHELYWIVANQRAAWNSPVWFNLGVKEREPQMHACHIMKIDDNLQSIMQQSYDEAMIFSLGSGVGTNVGSLRSSFEHIRGGGKASGPISFMRGYDRFAGVVQSGGKTRRAAIMRTISDSHPDVYHGPDSIPGKDFITIKTFNEKMARALVDAGFGGLEGTMNSPAYDTVAMQNANLSVRVSDEFMKAVQNNGDWSTKYVKENSGKVCKTFPAKAMFDVMAQGTWECGDPGIQFDDIINLWHTCKADGRINSSNPCVVGETLVATKNGLKRIERMTESSHEIVGGDGKIKRIDHSFATGNKAVYLLKTKSGYSLKLTGDHKVFTLNRGDVPAIELLKDDCVQLKGAGFGQETLDGRMAELIGIVVGDGCSDKDSIQITLGNDEKELADYLASSITDLKTDEAYLNDNADGRSVIPVNATHPQTTWRMRTTNKKIVDCVKRYAITNAGSSEKSFTDKFWELDKNGQAQIISGLFTADGCVVDSGEKNQYVGLDSTSLLLLQEVQIALLSFGIKSKIYENRRAADQLNALLPDGKGGHKQYVVKQMHALRITRSSRVLFESEIGFIHCSKKAILLNELNSRVGTYLDKMSDSISSIELIGYRDVYDLTEPETNHFVANGIVVHNCSEYLFLDDTSCNLASHNLMKYWSRRDGFNVEEFEHDVSLVFTACDISNSFAWLANKKLADGVKNYRTIGVGYCDLGNLILSNGFAYDSHKARLLMGAVTSLLTAICYKTSAELAERLSPFPRFGANKDSCGQVMRMHRQCNNDLEKMAGFENIYKRSQQLWDTVVSSTELGSGLRNAQATVLAPTGTIAFMMDADTTGPEPVLAHIAQKNLDGGGTVMIVQKSFVNGLISLGYSDQQVNDIQQYMKAYHTLESVRLPDGCNSLQEYNAKMRDESFVCPPKDRWTERKCPHLKHEHLPVFDTSFNASLGTRAIHHNGHIKALAAMQPFLSGGISKTINMPESATVEDIKEAYMLAWKSGVKCVAIYRNNCKRRQPLQTVTMATRDGKAATGPLRKEVPEDQETCYYHKAKVGNVKIYLHITTDKEGKPIEIFIRVGKQGDLASGLMDALAQIVSKSLQYGMPLEEVIETFKGMEFSPRGMTKDKFCRQAKSLLDYIGHYLEFRFGVKQNDFVGQDKIRAEAKERKLDLNTLVNYPSIMLCPTCSTPAKFLGGKCHQCPSCGWSEGGCSG